MLEGFLRSLKPPQGLRIPGWVEWVAASVTSLAFLPLGPISLAAGAATGIGIRYGRIRLQNKRLSESTPQTRAQVESWQLANKIVGLQRHQKLHSHVPQPVLEALESAARSWHEAMEELRIHAIEDPATVELIRAEVNMLMTGAVASAEKVHRRSNQGRRVLRAIEADAQLMEQVCRRIGRYTSQLAKWADDIAAPEAFTTGLRKQLVMAKAERDAAETELGLVLD